MPGPDQHSSNAANTGASQAMVFLGQIVVSPETYSPGEAEIIAFARQWDPFPWHTDKDAAQRSIYGGLTAPGVMIDAMLIRMVHGTVPWPAEAVVGLVGAESIRYIQAVRPADELSLRGQVVGLKRSQSNPDRTVVKLAWEMRRADGQLVYARTNILLFKSSYCHL